MRFNGAVEVAASGEKMYTRRRIYACANARIGRSHIKPSIKARCAFDISVITGVVPRCHEHRCSRVDLFYRLCQAPSANPQPLSKSSTSRSSKYIYTQIVNSHSYLPHAFGDKIITANWDICFRSIRSRYVAFDS